jgi:hypothetical protein
MVVSIHSLIAALRPEVFCQPWLEHHGRRQPLIPRVKQMARDKGYLAAAQIAQSRPSERLDLDDPLTLNPFSLQAFKHPTQRHQLVYDDLGTSLAATYFWLLDALPAVCPGLRQTEKLVDNFASAPGSTHFADLNRQLAQMQDRAVRMWDAARDSIERITSGIAELKNWEAHTRSAPETDVQWGFSAKADAARNRLRSDLALARLYARWLKPYLSYALQLEPRGQLNPDLVGGFNTVIIDVVLLATATDDRRKISGQRQLKYFHLLRVPLEFYGKDTAALGLRDVEAFERALSDDTLRSRLKNRAYAHATKVDMRVTLRVFLRWR